VTKNSNYVSHKKELRMACPIGVEPLPSDVAEIEIGHKRVILQGEVYAVIQPDYTYKPFANYATVSFYSSKAPVRYLKFKTLKEIENLNIKPKQKYRVYGCEHIAHSSRVPRYLVFDITKVEPISAELNSITPTTSFAGRYCGCV
jgi:hypothetical protein